MTSLVCPKCLGEEIKAKCSYTQEAQKNVEGVVYCNFDLETGGITDHLEFKEDSESIDEYEPDVDEDDVTYYCDHCDHESDDYEEFTR